MIAVTDNFDSTRKEDMESLALPIRNMVNTMYAKDISKKVWTSLQRKKEAGYAVGSDAPFGYIRNPVTKRNEIDPETAFYVQLIFQWVLMGVAIFEIARRLTLLNVPTPREWHRSTSNADWWICDFYDSAGGRQCGGIFGTGGSNNSASMVHIRRGET